MKAPTALLCPIDFSESSRSALRYAAAVAEHFAARLALLTVNDPLLEQAADMASGEGSLREAASTELERFFQDTFSGRPPGVSATFGVATGKPDAEILQVSRQSGADLIVMSSRGATGIRRLFLGSVTERVLRETGVPVLVTPPVDSGPVSPESIRKNIRRILVPVDLSAAMAEPVRVALALADTLAAQLLVVHVIEPVRTVVPGHAYAANVDSERRGRAEQRIQQFVESLPSKARIEPLVMFGDPAEEIAKIAADRQAALIVMALYASESGVHMGSVTYRVLSVTHGLVLAVPPSSHS